MIIKVLPDACIHLTGMSYYNNNYYMIPFNVNDCNILYEKYDGGDEFCGISIGILEEKKYVPKYWLHTYNDNETFIFDSDCIKDHNEWT